MRARLTQLVRLTAGYSLASYAGPIFTILLTPLYTRALRPADYAQLDLLTTIGGLAGSLAGFGLGHALTVLFYNDTDNHRRRVTGTAAALALAWSLAIALALWLAAPIIARTLLGGEAATGLVHLTALSVPLGALGMLMQTALRLRLAVGRSNALALVNLLLTVTLNILLVLVYGLGVWGVQFTLVIASLWLTLGGAVLLRCEGWGPPERILAGPLLRAGLGALPGILALWALGYLDRLLLPLYGIPATERGLYAIAAKLASMLAIVIMPFQIAWGPLALLMRDDPDANRTYARVLTLFTAGALGLALALALFAREILALFTTPAYLEAAPYVALLAYTTIANGVGVCAGIGAALERRTEVTGISLLIGAAANLLLNLLLIPLLGVWGAAWATAIGYGIVPILIYAWSQRIRPIPYAPGQVLVALLVQGALLGAGLLIDLQGWPGLALRVLLLAAYPAALLLLRVIEPDELRGMLRRTQETGHGDGKIR